jgi:hypothetical protein
MYCAKVVGRSDAMPQAYTEDQLVEQPAIGLFAEQPGRVVLLRALGSVVEPRIGPHFLEAFRERHSAAQ